jgi:hypothetical protein
MRKNALHITVLLIGLFLTFSSLTAQTPVIFKVPSLDLDTNLSEAIVEVQVESFSNVAGAQFSLKWDPTVFRFEELAGFGLPDLNENDNFNLLGANDGVLGFLWYDEAHTLNNGTAIFSMRMEIIGDLHDFSMFEFSNDPVTISVGDDNNNELPVQVIPGMITIGGLSGVNDLKAASLVSITPNPFKENTAVSFQLSRSSQTRLSIFNNEGQKILDRQMILGSGTHTIPIQKQVFPAAGNYLLTLKTEEFTITRKLVFVQ